MKQKVIDRYNGGETWQDIKDIENIKKIYNKNGSWYFERIVWDGFEYQVSLTWKKGREYTRDVEFYSWIFSPKYKVFEVFECPMWEIWKNIDKWFIVKDVKSPKEILSSLAGVK